MSDDASKDPEVRITTAAELFSALEGGNGVLLLGTLQAIGSAPAKALDFGSHEGRDVIDVLVRLSHNGTGTTAGAVVATTLAAFGDPRAQEELCRLWTEADDDDTLRTVAKAARAWRTPALVEAMRARLFDTDRLRVALAASVFADLAEGRPDPAASTPGESEAPAPRSIGAVELSVRERLRVAVAVEDRGVPPTLDATTVPVWAAELDGPFAPEAAELADAAGREGVAVMLAAWDTLGPGARKWVVARSDEAVGRALEDEDARVRDAALAALAGRGAAVGWRRQLSALWRSGDADLRLAVMRAGLDGVDWRPAISDPDSRVRTAALRCLARDEGAAVAGEIALRLADEDWRMRAAATDALCMLGPAGVDAARTRLHHARTEVRYAAAQVLIAAEEWDEVEEAFLGAS